MSENMESPIVAGGQGRTDAEIEAAGMTMLWACMAVVVSTIAVCGLLAL